MLEPYQGKIYDPCCGSGGMFVQSVKFVQSHQGKSKDIAVFGQELTATTYKLAKMNLAIRGLSGNLGEKPADTFFNDQHKDLKADFIMANPPFNLKDWRNESEMTDEGIALTNNEAERALRGYVLWRKGSYGVWSHRHKNLHIFLNNF